jgi:hypothetical protein
MNRSQLTRLPDVGTFAPQLGGPVRRRAMDGDY